MGDIFKLSNIVLVPANYFDYELSSNTKKTLELADGCLPKILALLQIDIIKKSLSEPVQNGIRDVKTVLRHLSIGDKIESECRYFYGVFSETQSKKANEVDLSEKIERMAKGILHISSSLNLIEQFYPLSFVDDFFKKIPIVQGLKYGGIPVVSKIVLSTSKFFKSFKSFQQDTTQKPLTQEMKVAREIKVLDLSLAAFKITNQMMEFLKGLSFSKDLNVKPLKNVMDLTTNFISIAKVYKDYEWIELKYQNAKDLTKKRIQQIELISKVVKVSYKSIETVAKLTDFKHPSLVYLKIANAVFDIGCYIAKESFKPAKAA